MGRLFLFLLVFIFLEAVVVAKVAQLIGWGTTLLLLLGTTLLGSALVRRQGFVTWVRLNQRLQAGESPGQELADGMLTLLGGFLLVVPGFITDGFGLVLLFPPFRRALAAMLVRRGLLQAFARPGQAGWAYSARYQSASTYDATPDTGPEPGRPRVQEDRNGHLVIEGEVERKDE